MWDNLAQTAHRIFLICVCDLFCRFLVHQSVPGSYMKVLRRRVLAFDSQMRFPRRRVLRLGARSDPRQGLLHEEDSWMRALGLEFLDEGLLD